MYSSFCPLVVVLYWKRIRRKVNKSPINCDTATFTIGSFLFVQFFIFKLYLVLKESEEINQVYKSGMVTHSASVLWSVRQQLSEQAFAVVKSLN